MLIGFLVIKQQDHSQSDLFSISFRSKRLENRIRKTFFSRYVLLLQPNLQLSSFCILAYISKLALELVQSRMPKSQKPPNEQKQNNQNHAKWPKTCWKSHSWRWRKGIKSVAWRSCTRTRAMIHFERYAFEINRKLKFFAQT